MLQLLREFVFIGRGGQGLYTSIELLSRALFLEGYYVQATPFFGAERRGAVTFSYLRIDTTKIERHDRVKNPDGIFIADSSEEIIRALKNYRPKSNAVIVLNLDRTNLETLIEAIPNFSEFSYYGVKADKIAIEERLVVSGWPVIGTVFSGSFSRVYNIPSIDNILKTIELMFGRDYRLQEINKKVARRAYDETEAIK